MEHVVSILSFGYTTQDLVDVEYLVDIFSAKRGWQDRRAPDSTLTHVHRRTRSKHRVTADG